MEEIISWVEKSDGNDDMSDKSILIIVAEVIFVGLSVAIGSFLNWAGILFFIIGQVLILFLISKIDSSNS